MEIEDIEAAAEDGEAAQIADLLGDVFTQTWLALSGDALRRALIAMEGQEVTEETLSEFVGRLAPTMTDDFAEVVQSDLRDGKGLAYQVGRAPGGRSLAGESIDVLAGINLNQADRRALRQMQEQYTYWIGTHYSRQVQDRIRTVARDVLTGGTDGPSGSLSTTSRTGASGTGGDSTTSGQAPATGGQGTPTDGARSQQPARASRGGMGVGRFQAGQRFQAAFQSEFAKSASYWELLANHVTTRSRTFGRLEGFVEAGIERYEIDTIPDDRRSDVCECLEGQQYDVSDAVEHRDALLSAETPEATKGVSPWLSADVICPLSESELVARGVILPPFHGNCRSTIQPV